MGFSCTALYNIYSFFFNISAKLVEAHTNKYHTAKEVEVRTIKYHTVKEAEFNGILFDIWIEKISSVVVVHSWNRDFSVYFFSVSENKPIMKCQFEVRPLQLRHLFLITARV